MTPSRTGFCSCGGAVPPESPPLFRRLGYVTATSVA